MKGKQWFAFLGAVAIGVLIYRRLMNPRCKWCDAALTVLATGQVLACPSCGRVA